jgi:hypothetical protein
MNNPMKSLHDMTNGELRAEIKQWLASKEAAPCEVCPKCGEMLGTIMFGGLVVIRPDKPHACRDTQVKFLSGYGRLQPDEYVFPCTCEEVGCKGFVVNRASGYTEHYAGQWSEEERTLDLLREIAKRLSIPIRRFPRGRDARVDLREIAKRLSIPMVEQEEAMRVWVCSGCDMVEEAMPHDTVTGEMSAEHCLHCEDGAAMVKEATPEQRARALPADPSQCDCETCKAEVSRRKRPL